MLVVVYTEKGGMGKRMISSLWMWQLKSWGLGEVEFQADCLCAWNFEELRAQGQVSGKFKWHLGFQGAQWSSNYQYSWLFCSPYFIWSLCYLTLLASSLLSRHSSSVILSLFPGSLPSFGEILLPSFFFLCRPLIEYFGVFLSSHFKNYLFFST